MKNNKYILFLFTLLLPIALLLGEEEKLTGPAQIIVSPIKINYCGFSLHVLDVENVTTDKDVFLEASAQFHPPNKKPMAFKTNQKGKLTYKNQPLLFQIVEETMFRGERATYRFITSNKEELAKVSYIPKPLLFQSKNNTFRAEFELIILEPATYLVHFFGLSENEKLKFSESYNKSKIEGEHVYNKEKPFGLMLVEEKGKVEAAKLQFTRANGDILKADIAMTSEIWRQRKDDIKVARRVLPKLKLQRENM